jgi:hypothetical protein
MAASTRRIAACDSHDLFGTLESAALRFVE